MCLLIPRFLEQACDNLINRNCAPCLHTGLCQHQWQPRAVAGEDPAKLREAYLLSMLENEAPPVGLTVSRSQTVGWGDAWPSSGQTMCCNRQTFVPSWS